MMEKINLVIEGYMVKYKDTIWAVKGCYHPDGYVVAIPRLVNGKKIKKVNEAMKIAKEKFPCLFKYVEEIGFEVPLIPLKEAEILDPFKKEVRDKVVREFMSYFDGKIGVTGSLLYSNSFNDMDFLSFNKSHYSKLKELREKGVTSALSTYENEEVETLNPKDFVELKKNRVLEGVYKGIPYTFKIVECIDFGIVESKERFEGVVKIIRAEKPYSLPVMYLTDKGYYLTSFRTRFTELREGTALYVDGILLKRNKFLDLDLDIAKEVKIL